MRHMALVTRQRARRSHRHVTTLNAHQLHVICLLDYDPLIYELRTEIQGNSAITLECQLHCLPVGMAEQPSAERHYETICNNYDDCMKIFLDSVDRLPYSHASSP
jgi:hypothetical protein